MKKKIGIFLSVRKPSEGGGYTITQEILNTFISEIKSQKIEKNFFFLVVNDFKYTIINQLKKKLNFSI